MTRAPNYLQTASILLAAALGFSARPGSASGQDEASPSNTDCLSCHESTVERGHGRAIPPIAAAFAPSLHGQAGVSCVDCHADLRDKELPHPDKLAQAACSACHEDAVKAYEQSVHAGSRQRSSASDAARCSDCHGMHDIRSAKDPASPTYHFNVAGTCAKCHADQAIIAKAHIDAGNVPEHFLDSIHGRALSKSGLLVAPNCATCHGNHEIRRAADNKSRVHRANVPETCGGCHAGILTVYQTSVHAEALRKGSSRAAVCSDCHTAHDTQVVSAAWKVEMVKQCGTCHQESIRTFRDTFHGKVSTLGFTRAATCADCHGAHGILPKEDPRSLISDHRRVETCRKCHAAATVNFSRYDPHADEHDQARNPVLFTVAQAMRLLLMGVFAFFGLHTLLWLGRSLVLVRRLRAEGKIDDDHP